MANYSKNKRILLIKRETTPGTEVAPVSADFNVRLRGIEGGVPEIAMDDEAAKFATGDHGLSEAIPGTQAGAPPFFFKLAYSGAVATAPNWSKVMEMCGFLGAAKGLTGYKWEDVPDADNQTATLDLIDILVGANAGAQRSRFAGVMGNVVIGAEGVGSPIIARVTPRGKWSGNAVVASGSIPVLTSPDTTAEERFIGATATVGGVSYKCSSFEYDAGAEIQLLDDLPGATGIEHAWVSNRNGVRLRMNLRKLTIAEHDILSQWKNGTVIAASIQTTNFRFTWPRVQILSVADAELNGDVRYDVTFRVLRNAGADASVANNASFQLLQGT